MGYAIAVQAMCRAVCTLQHDDHARRSGCSNDTLSVATLDSNLIEQIYAHVRRCMTGCVARSCRRDDARRCISLRCNQGTRFSRSGSAPALPLRSIPTIAASPVSMCPSQCCVKRAVLREMRRVCRVGGHIVLLNHFLSDMPFLSKVERLLSPIATARLGFRTDLDARPLLERARLRPIAIRKVNTPKIWTLVNCRRDD